MKNRLLTYDSQGTSFTEAVAPGIMRQAQEVQTVISELTSVTRQWRLEFVQQASAPSSSFREYIRIPFNSVNLIRLLL